jgi:hypothetical protein
VTDGAARFAARYPLLCHVTARSSLASIRRNGLLPPTALRDLFQVSGNRRAYHKGRDASRRLLGSSLDCPDGSHRRP